MFFQIKLKVIEILKHTNGRQLAISDIHGCLKSFKALLQKVSFSKADELFLLGDYLDRGPDSKGVIDYVWYLQKQGYTVRCLRGNHEAMVLNDLEAGELWGYGSDAAMLKSFDAKDVTEIPVEYVKWIDQLPYFAETEGYLLVHAGFDFSSGNPFDNIDAMLWMRDWYANLNQKWLGNRVIIHGHTPVEQDSIVSRLNTLPAFPVLDIDNGCFFSRYGMGYLCAFDMTNRELFFQKNKDREWFFEF